MCCMYMGMQELNLPLAIQKIQKETGNKCENSPFIENWTSTWKTTLQLVFLSSLIFSPVPFWISKSGVYISKQTCDILFIIY